jgi:hypothetical protein
VEVVHGAIDWAETAAAKPSEMIEAFIFGCGGGVEKLEREIGGKTDVESNRY